MATPPAASDASPPSVEEFIKTVLRSGLLDKEQLLSRRKALSTEQRGDSEALAQLLVRTGKLSRFQARKLMKGVSRGLILGSFQLLALIGRGGMGSVYLVRDSRDGQLVALKVLPPNKARTKERLLARFQREMELSQRVRHPNLCRTFEVGQLHGVHYLAMEFIPGQTLSQIVHTQGPLELPRAARLLAEVASGLEHAHQQGLVHRDLKPSNILITPQDHAKVLDMGLAMMRGEDVDDPKVAGGRGYIVGTMDYIAPEQTTDAMGVDGRADIYSLGCTMYFTLTGRPPFPGGTSVEKVYRQRSEEPESLSQLRLGLPPQFVSLVKQMMAKEPRQRFPSARAVEEQLWRWAEAEPTPQADLNDDATLAAAIAVLQAAGSTSEDSSTNLDLLIEPEQGATEGDEVTVPPPPAEPKKGSGIVGFLIWAAIAVVLELLLGVVLHVLGLLGRH